MVKVRSLFAIALTVALAVPPAWARNTAREQRELQQLAQDLNRALGTNAAEVSGRVTPANIRLDADGLIEAMNRERTARGLHVLRLNDRLSMAAEDRVTDMFSKHYFEHVSPDGIDPWSWVDKRGYDYTEIGENLAVGYRTTPAVVDGWMHSPGHRANILKAHFDEVGVAIATGSPERRYTGPTVVVIYGSRS